MKNLFFLVLLSLFSCNKNNDNPSEDSKYIQKTVQYQSISGVKSKLTSLDINYFDKWTDLKPVMIFIHGGGWVIGDKTNKPSSKIELFKGLGYVYISINYRLSPFPYQLDNPNRILHPTHVKDVAKAIKYIYDNIEDYGGNKSNIAIMGHSAGAHLASLIATDPKYLNAEGLKTSIFKGVVSLDTQASDIDYAMQHTFEGSDLYKMYINAFGDTSNKWKEASPINYVSSSLAKNWVVVYRGSQTRMTNQLRYIDALKAEGKSVTAINAVDYSHSGVNDAIGNTNDTVINKPIVEFLVNVLN